MNLKTKVDHFYQWFKEKKRVTYPVLAVAIGIVAGYLYYYYIGCNSGSCPITSSPWSSMGIGVLMGWLLVSK
ncbi:MAG TPA: DUF6132 family protein [Tenuifilum sp.]|nr:hypothetical protein [Bacteroidales bacterium]HOK60184.1 DUF6132 family protein [Tenuifilum sp.]HOK86643.1 DUF6132 family protein [Tenuifilum sp.]HPP89160.1 DUF6132 family protein [Tenuifilum sp.]HQG71384.1 DUF6132 family protein [Tenuifilum sp.]